MDNAKSILVATNSQKVLEFFLDHPGRELTEKETQNSVKVSKSGTNYALRELAKANFLLRDKKGKMSFYSLNYKNPAIKQLKVLKIIMFIQPIIKKLAVSSSQITLFGSSARGEDISDSDIDLFVISNSKKQELERVIEKIRLKRKIQLIVETELFHTELKVKSPDFYEQVQRGIVLWRREQ
ncbi:MAG: nucleotidyltransferase domain-containing protein [Candidatus Omnitrophica bacterium]|nr:nucleotidyltransferase domain-containing protein [Candidatus Omnitrophota bacterium]